MGAGFASGLAAGISSGRSKTRTEIAEYIALNGFTIHDSQGRTVGIDECLDEALNTPFGAGTSQHDNKLKVIGILIGLVALGLLSLFLLMR